MTLTLCTGAGEYLPICIARMRDQEAHLPQRRGGDYI